MIRILLIRHATTEPLGRVLYGRTPGVHINAEGEQQALKVAREVKLRFRLNEVVSSPLERTVETAQIIASEQDLSVTTDEGLSEVDFGSWAGKTFKELQERDDWKLYNRSRSTACPPGGESMMQVQDRAWRSLARIVARYPDQESATVAVVSHGDVVRGLLLLLLGMPIDLIHRLDAAPASISEVWLGGDQPFVKHINQIF